MCRPFLSLYSLHTVIKIYGGAVRIAETAFIHGNQRGPKEANLPSPVHHRLIKFMLNLIPSRAKFELSHEIPRTTRRVRSAFIRNCMVKSPKRMCRCQNAKRIIRTVSTLWIKRIRLDHLQSTNTQLQVFAIS